MKKLSVPLKVCGQYLDKIISCKRGLRKQTLQNILPEVKFSYIEYIQNRFQLESLIPLVLKPAEIIAMKHCYNSSTNSLSELKSKILNNLKSNCEFDVQRCPYCLVRMPDQWDHFLPKDHFPEYSVLPINLIYVCGSCNLKKLNVMYSHPREVLNVYFDQIPNKEVLKCEVSTINNIPKIRYFIDSQDNSYEVQILRRHFEAFNLGRLYLGEGKTVISTFIEEMALRYPGGLNQEKLSEELSIQFQKIPLAMGINHWEAATYRGLNQCRNLLSSINSRIQERALSAQATAGDWRRR